MTSGLNQEKEAKAKVQRSSSNNGPSNYADEPKQKTIGRIPSSGGYVNKAREPHSSMD